ncbi:MAG: sirohydrochlorin chelatase [Leucothrix sp.]
MKTLLLVAHGSRVASSNETVVDLVQKLRPRLAEHGFCLATHAFLELTNPNITQGVEKLISSGATEVVVLPYFLAPGTHVIDDVPAFIQQAQSTYPEVIFTLMPHLGGVEGMVDLVLNSAGLSLQ